MQQFNNSIGIDEVGLAASKRRVSPHTYVIGIDEVGRGALAGPIVVAALAAPTKLRMQNAELIIGKNKNSKFFILNSKVVRLRDSKKLSPRQREEWFSWIKRMNADKQVDKRGYADIRSKKRRAAFYYKVARVSPKVIDKINIAKAANLAASRAVARLIKNAELRIKNYKIFLDGGLYLNKISANQRTHLRLSASTIVKGDEKIPAIMLASIIAKVRRDRYMKKLHKKYPRYDFINNVGYGTKKHIKAIKKYGHSKTHRKSFKI